MSPVLICARLTAPDDFNGWRNKARGFLAAEIRPDRIVWEVGEDGMPDMFAQDAPPAVPIAGPPTVSVPRDLLSLIRQALLHSAPSRFALAYRLLWRLKREPGLAHDPADPDLIALRQLAKAVQRDIHKMHAFVRFRKVGEAHGRERFAAWFEPEHHIVRAVAGFFRDRFTALDWLIVTPETSIGWDGSRLSAGPGGERADVPAEDAVEAEWRAYYASIFNPARVKIAAMKREMPVRYWRNLPETMLIPSLIQDAAERVEEMVSEKPAPDLFATDKVAAPSDQPHYDSLAALYAALRAQDVPPSPDFADRLVLGEGPVHAPILIVGEQPGDQEDLAGHVFVGPAGQLLDRCLAEAGIARDEVFLTNAVKRFKYAPRGKKRLHQTPNAGDIAHYRWWLAEEVRLVDPRVVVALGATALQALTGRKQALGPLRGAPMPWQDRELLVTVHPSFLLRLPDAQAREIERGKFIRELSRAARAA